jgi:hypothetical protein
MQDPRSPPEAIGRVNGRFYHSITRVTYVHHFMYIFRLPSSASFQQ